MIKVSRLSEVIVSLLAMQPFLLVILMLWGPPEPQAWALQVGGELVSILKSEILINVILVILQLVGLALLLRSLHQWAETKAQAWLQGLQDATQISEENTPLDDSFLGDGNQTAKNRLHSQFNNIQARANHHATVMKFFYTRYYTTIVLISVTGLVAAVCAIYLSSKGWGTDQSWIQTIFLTMSAATLYFTAFPKVYKQSENIFNNTNAYLSYLNLENELLSYVCTGEYKDGEPTSLNNFIHYLDQEMENRNKLYLGFDESKIPDFRKQLIQKSQILQTTPIAQEKRIVSKNTTNIKDDSTLPTYTTKKQTNNDSDSNIESKNANKNINPKSKKEVQPA